MIECVRLNRYGSFGENDILNRTVSKRAATYIDDISAEVESVHINGSFRTRVCYNRNITARKPCVLPISVSYYISNTEIISKNAVIPVLCQIQRQGLRRKVYVYVLRTDTREFAYIFNRSGNAKGSQTCTIIECVTTNVSHAFGNVEFGQAFAKAECKVIDISNFRVAKINTCQLAHSFKSVRLNARQRASLHKRYGPKIVTTFKHIRGNTRKLAVFREGKCGQVRTSLKRSLRHCGYVCGHCKGS